MKLFLLLFVLQFIDVTSSKNDPIWKLNHERKAELIAENQQQEHIVAGPYCQSLVAHFFGTFRSKDVSNQNFTAQFRILLDADLKRKRITVGADQWNEQLVDSKDFALDFYYSSNYQWCDINEEDCSASFSKNITNFKLDLNKQDGTFYHLLYFDYFNNSFVLNEPDGKCTNYQLDGLSDEWTPDLIKLRMCICCDDYRPTALLSCPQDPTKSNCEASTPAVPKTTTVKPTPPPSGNITCSKLVAYYNGVFKNGDPYRQMSVEFQTRMWADDQNYYTKIDQWNEDRTKNTDIVFWLYSSGYAYLCDPPTNNNCSAPYSSQDDIWLNINHYINGNGMNTYFFSYFPASNKQFTLYNTVNGCTKFQPVNGYSPDPAVDPAYFDFCMCCGDTYNPPSSLNCPVNPWA